MKSMRIIALVIGSLLIAIQLPRLWELRPIGGDLGFYLGVLLIGFSIFGYTLGKPGTSGGVRGEHCARCGSPENLTRHPVAYREGEPEGVTEYYWLCSRCDADNRKPRHPSRR